MKKEEIINLLIEKYHYNTYLEIGVQNGFSIRDINLPKEQKIGVDPVKLCDSVTYEMTSDEFFNQNKQLFDIIFIDGLHIYKQVIKDIFNALNYLTQYGTIICHDCNPAEERCADESGPYYIWNGSVYKAIIELRCTVPNLNISVVDTDYGCGIIRTGKQELYLDDPLEKCQEWNYFATNRKKLLNLISVDEFRKIYLS